MRRLRVQWGNQRWRQGVGGKQMASRYMMEVNPAGLGGHSREQELGMTPKFPVRRTVWMVGLFTRMGFAEGWDLRWVGFEIL